MNHDRFFSCGDTRIPEIAERSGSSVDTVSDISRRIEVTASHETEYTFFGQGYKSITLSNAACQQNSSLSDPSAAFE